jgi:hypothetical protein
MLTTVLVRRVIPVVLAIAVCGTALVFAGRASSEATGAERLPDLVQVTPTDLVITHVGASYRLGFRSAVSNLGDGPLMIKGHRPGAEVGTMVADQVVERDGAPAEVVPDTGRLRYVVSPDHRHWHLLGFERYELRRAAGRARLVTDRKTGFCLGDRYRVRDHELRAQPPEPIYTGHCGLERTALLGLTEGICQQRVIAAAPAALASRPTLSPSAQLMPRDSPLPTPLGHDPMTTP